MASKLQICNKALTLMGVSRISELTNSEGENARRLIDEYPLSLRTMLRVHDWSFVKSSIYLAQLDEVNPNYMYCYQYPIDCIKARRIYRKGDKRSKQSEYEILKGKSGKMLATNTPMAILDYTSYDEDTSLFNDDVVNLLAATIAKELVLAVTGRSDMLQAAEHKYYNFLSQAKYSDTIESNIDDNTESEFISCRS